MDKSNRRIIIFQDVKFDESSIYDAQMHCPSNMEVQEEKFVFDPNFLKPMTNPTLQLNSQSQLNTFPNSPIESIIQQIYIKFFIFLPCKIVQTLILLKNFQAWIFMTKRKWLSPQEVGEMIKQHMSRVMHNDKCLIQVVHDEKCKKPSRLIETIEVWSSHKNKTPKVLLHQTLMNLKPTPIQQA